METLKRACRYFYYRFIRLQANPENLARGVAVGLFISTTPTFGVQTLIALFFAALFRCSKICAVVAAQLTNVLTAPFIFLGTYYLGAIILDNPFDRSKLNNLTWEGLTELGPSVFASLWVGGTLVGLVLAAIGYFVVLGIDTKAHVQIVRAKQKMDRLKRKNAPVYEKID